MHDPVSWRVRWRVDRSDGPTVHGEGNLLLTAGANRVLSLLTGAAVTPLEVGSCRVGVGDGTTAVDAAQTNLQGANRWFEPASSVSVTGNTLTIVSSFDPYVANFAWEEWGIDFGVTASAVESAPLLNRKVTSIGTKAAGATWQFTIEVSLA